MADRISDLPDMVICHILSFLPTKFSVATSILSKRWKSLWRSVPTFDFDCECDEYEDALHREEGINYKFLHSINTFLQTRDSCRCLTRFSLICPSHGYHRRCQPKDVYELIWEHHKLEYLYLFQRGRIDFLSVTLHCRITLIHLELIDAEFKTYLPVDLPSLKILHLWHFYSPEYKFLADLLSRCPNLEDMGFTGIIKNYTTEVDFKKCPKLVRAVLLRKGLVPLELVSNVKFLEITRMNRPDKIIKNMVPRFDNLTHLRLAHIDDSKDWSEPFRLIERCPKLERLDLLQGLLTQGLLPPSYHDPERKDWKNPSQVPKCFSSHLKTCRIGNYGDSETEFKLVKYIMRNATVLQNMVIRIYTLTEEERFRVRKKLRSVCRRLSSSCKISFLSDDDSEI